MKISEKKLIRKFYYDGNLFYTKYFYNMDLKYKIENKSKEEFIIYLINGNIIKSSDMKAKILEKNSNNIKVEFKKDALTVFIKFYKKNNVIKKKISIKKYDERINYIDIEYLNFSNKENIFFNKNQENNKSMGNFSGFYMELGQPIYAKSLFLGSEFPMTLNKIKEKNGMILYYSRYYYGKNVKKELMIHPSIVGSVSSLEKNEIRKGFFKYIQSISYGLKLRKQYNSWYDHMININNKNIIESFKKINEGFSKYGISLDAFVVDDGWANYESVWEFNGKFPNELKEVLECVKEMKSSLGLWIGPRGGYNGTQIKMSDWLEKNRHLNIGSKNKISNDVNVGDINYLRKMRQKMLEYQSKYDISYWKIDGMLLKPDINDETGEYGMHTMTMVYEFMIRLFKELRFERKGRDFWINLTSYVNPSPWFLKWVNSLWLQVSGDIGFTENAGDDIDRMITYRDGQYYELLNEREIQLPLFSIYNHDPIYAETANTWYLDHKIYCEPEKFKDYLMFISTRGNSFWEFYYSHTMFDEKRWRKNAEAIKWIENNYYILKNSSLYGDKASEMTGIYGYFCESDDGKEFILSCRNPSNELKEYIFELKNKYELETVIGLKDKFKIENNRIIMNLKPREILIIKAKR